MATLHDEILINDLEENFADDPYGTATYVIRNMLSRALSDHMNGRMNETEWKNLDALAKTITSLDAHATVEPMLG